MSVVDWIIVGAVAVSVLLGLWRGLLREVLSLAAWIIGVLLALRYAPMLGAQLPFDLWPAARIAIAAVAIVLGCVITAAIVAWVLRQILKAVKLSGLDRVLGGLFGLLRAALIVGLAVYLARGTAVTKQAFWEESVLLPHIETAVEAAVRWMAPLLPVAHPMAQA